MDSYETEIERLLDTLDPARIDDRRSGRDALSRLLITVSYIDRLLSSEATRALPREETLTGGAAEELQGWLNRLVEALRKIVDVLGAASFSVSASTHVSVTVTFQPTDAQAALAGDIHDIEQIAESLASSGNYPVARDLGRKVLDERERILDRDDPDILAGRHNLACWTGLAGDAAGARDQLAALLPVRERVSGPEHPHTLDARTSLAVFAGLAGDAAAARDQYAALLPVRAESRPGAPPAPAIRPIVGFSLKTTGSPTRAPSVPRL